MSSTAKTKEVYFTYCNTCDHKQVLEKDEPCFTCLKQGYNEYSHYPIKYSGPKSTTKKDWKEGK